MLRCSFDAEGFEHPEQEVKVVERTRRDEMERRIVSWGDRAVQFDGNQNAAAAVDPCVCVCVCVCDICNASLPVLRWGPRDSACVNSKSRTPYNTGTSRPWFLVTLLLLPVFPRLLAIFLLHTFIIMFTHLSTYFPFCSIVIIYILLYVCPNSTMVVFFFCFVSTFINSIGSVSQVRC
jgi:hypothetical protein